ncbi:MAG: acyltransferase [Geodermatophilales bacterium]|nr:acyltransferase [Geodermatophilales bacterium]
MALTRLPRRIPEIRPLTGLRIVAALLVVLFHMRGNLRVAFPDLADAAWPVLDSGLLGVDLFFALSGFVLTINYIDAVGVRLTRSGTARFLWARIARIWPAYVVTLIVAGLWHAGLPVIGWQDPVPVRDLSALSFLRQFGLVVLWNEPSYERLTWNGPAWSVSAEALAYLAFPVLALLLFRLDRAVRARSLVWLGVSVLVPLMILGAIDLYGPYVWLIRLAGAFVAGSLAALAVRKVWAHVDEHRHRSWPAVLTWLSAVAAQLRHRPAARHPPAGLRRANLLQRLPNTHAAGHRAVLGPADPLAGFPRRRHGGRQELLPRRPGAGLLHGLAALAVRRGAGPAPDADDGRGPAAGQTRGGRAADAAALGRHRRRRPGRRHRGRLGTRHRDRVVHPGARGGRRLDRRAAPPGRQSSSRPSSAPPSSKKGRMRLSNMLRAEPMAMCMSRYL